MNACFTAKAPSPFRLSYVSTEQSSAWLRSTTPTKYTAVQGAPAHKLCIKQHFQGLVVDTCVMHAHKDIKYDVKL